MNNEEFTEIVRQLAEAQGIAIASSWYPDIEPSIKESLNTIIDKLEITLDELIKDRFENMRSLASYEIGEIPLSK